MLYPLPRGRFFPLPRTTAAPSQDLREKEAFLAGGAMNADAEAAEAAEKKKKYTQKGILSVIAQAREASLAAEAADDDGTAWTCPFEREELLDVWQTKADKVLGNERKRAHKLLEKYNGHYEECVARAARRAVGRRSFVCVASGFAPAKGTSRPRTRVPRYRRAGSLLRVGLRDVDKQTNTMAVPFFNGGGAVLLCVCVRVVGMRSLARCVLGTWRSRRRSRSATASSRRAAASTGRRSTTRRRRR